MQREGQEGQAVCQFASCVPESARDLDQCHAGVALATGCRLQQHLHAAAEHAIGAGHVGRGWDALQVTALCVEQDRAQRAESSNTQHH